MKKKHLKVLHSITASIPKDLISNLTVLEDQFPTLREIVTRGLEDPDVPEDKKERFKAILASGYLDKKVEVLNEPIEKQISEYIDFEIEKAIKEGRLPPRRNWPKLKLKSKKYVKAIQKDQASIPKSE